MYINIFTDAEKADSAHGLMDGERDQKEVVFNTLQAQQPAAATTKKGSNKNVQPMRVGKGGDSATGSPMRTPSDGSDNDA